MRALMELEKGLGERDWVIKKEEIMPTSEVASSSFLLIPHK